jgi:hypothetical protein
LLVVRFSIEILRAVTLWQDLSSGNLLSTDGHCTASVTESLRWNDGALR